MIAALAHILPPADSAALIADSGQPNFPGWEALAALLVGATLLALMAGQGDLFRRPSPRVRPPILRVLRVGPKTAANGVRGATTAARTANQRWAA